MCAQLTALRPLSQRNMDKHRIGCVSTAVVETSEDEGSTLSTRTTRHSWLQASPPLPFGFGAVQQHPTACDANRNCHATTICISPDGAWVLGKLRRRRWAAPPGGRRAASCNGRGTRLVDKLALHNSYWRPAKPRVSAARPRPAGAACAVGLRWAPHGVIAAKSQAGRRQGAAARAAWRAAAPPANCTAGAASTSHAACRPCAQRNGQQEAGQGR